MQTREQILDEARAAGIDLDLLDANLALTVKQRWEQHQAVLDFVEKLQAAKAARESINATQS